MAETPQEVTDEIILRLGGFSLFAVFMNFLATKAYYIICESAHGSTLGKRICGLVVVAEDGSACRFLPAFGRSLIFLIDGLFFGAVAATSMTTSPLKQRYGDKWWQTVVVKRSALDSSQLRPRWRFVLVLLGAVLVYSLILFFSEMIKLIG